MEIIRKTIVKFNDPEQNAIADFLDFIEDLGCDHRIKPDCEMCPFNALCGLSLEDVIKQMARVFD